MAVMGAVISRYIVLAFRSHFVDKTVQHRIGYIAYGCWSSLNGVCGASLIVALANKRVLLHDGRFE